MLIIFYTSVILDSLSRAAKPNPYCYNYIKVILIKFICINSPILFLITVICNNEVCTPECHCKFYLIIALNLIYRYAWLPSIVC